MMTNPSPRISPHADKQLTVYKASAGSGKTFRLSVEYIKLLIDDPQSFRNILAVTFTNKATGEMKTRILSQLYGIWKDLPESAGYKEKVMSEMGVTSRFASERAGIALGLIIHNYSYFRIQTIDTFFQSVLRNLARELDLTANMRLELNDVQVEQQAVDVLIDELTAKDVVLKWIMSYIRERIDDDRSWNVIGFIKDFGRHIFRDYYKSNSERLQAVISRPHFFEDFTGRLHAIINRSKSLLEETGEGFLDILDEHGLTPDDFLRKGSGVCGYFIKMRDGVTDESKLLTKTVMQAMEDSSPDPWVKKGMKDKQRQTDMQELASTTLHDYLVAAEQTRKRAFYDMKSAELTLAHLHQLRLLNSIEQKVREMNAEANRFLLSDTQTLLHTLIRESDTPFIYEKIGTQLDHIMIDEFQDTSTIQWANFRVLLEECMSRGRRGNLLVGDVKQSIYRWRSGDWRLLNHIETQFKDADARLRILPPKSDGDGGEAARAEWCTNYRSARRIITFNNYFFEKAAHLEYETLAQDGNPSAGQMLHAYGDVRQTIPERRGDEGYVSITLVPPRKDEPDIQLEKTRDTLTSLLELGVPPGKIAILVRNNTNIQKIAAYLTATMPEVKIVSDEAFRIGGSLAVRMIVAAMHLLTHPEDDIVRGFLVKSYQRYCRKSPASESELLVREDLAALLPKAYTERREALMTTPVYDLAEELYTLFELAEIEGQSAYLCEFFDQLHTYLADNVADIDSFIEEWNSTLRTKSITASEPDGVRIISIHKSKGLEYENVIIPYCDWKLEIANTIWCSPDKAPYSELPLVPVDLYAKKLKGSVYEADYAEEHLQNMVDNLNLLYVAFTRAEKRLYVIGQKGSAGTRAHLIETALDALYRSGQLEEGVTRYTNDEDGLLFTYGETGAEEPHAEKKGGDGNVFLPRVDKADVVFQPQPVLHAHFRQSNQSQEFIMGEAESERLSYIKTGSLLHHLFSMITTAADIDKALTQMETEGLLSPGGMTRGELRHFLDERLRQPMVREWFSDRWRVFSECTVLSVDPGSEEVREHRPDRVMTDGREMIVIDYKFGVPRPEHERQVRDYMSLMRGMGHTEVRGYLWYVYANQTKEVR